MNAGRRLDEKNLGNEMVRQSQWSIGTAYDTTKVASRMLSIGNAWRCVALLLEQRRIAGVANENARVRVIAFFGQAGGVPDQIVVHSDQH